MKVGPFFYGAYAHAPSDISHIATVQNIVRAAKHSNATSTNYIYTATNFQAWEKYNSKLYTSFWEYVLIEIEIELQINNFP